MAGIPEKWDLDTEVLVVGTGGGALTAAILAYDNGAKVTIIEKSDKVGGTTSVSGGGVWVPLNHHMTEHGIQDSREDALTYCKILVNGRADDDLIETYVDTAKVMIKYLEDNSPLKMDLIKLPDYHPEKDGAHSGSASRSLGPALFNTNDLGDKKDKYRLNPHFGFPMTFNDMEEWQALSKPHQVPFDEIARRMELGMVGMGSALMGYMYKGCLDRGLDPVINTRAVSLIAENGRVIGLKAEQEGKPLFIHASKAVILGCGGFEWSEEMKAAFLPGNITHPNSPPHNEGDGIKMCMELGADLGNMSEIWGMASLSIKGESYDDKPLNRCSMAERSLPHVIILNKQGKRFVNEAASYNDFFKPFWEKDENTCEYKNLPAWHIFDQQFHNKYAMLSVYPGADVPDWVEQDDTLTGLAGKLGIDPDVFTATIERFNGFARKGVDEDYSRGKSEYDRYWGDPDQKPNPVLGTIEIPPFYALRTYTGSIGTKGGVKINTKGQVLHVSGNPIPGLYATGNTTAGISGPGYWGAGGTIGPAMTYGYICGINATKE